MKLILIKLKFSDSGFIDHVQMNVGASKSIGRILYFLHA